MKDLLNRLTSRKFILTVVTFLLFIFAEKLGLDSETQAKLLATFLGYVGVEGLKDISAELKK